MVSICKEDFMRLFATTAVLAVALSLLTPASAAVLTFNVMLTGAQETPPTATPATGQATLTLEDAVNVLLVNLTYSGLVSPATNAHIHCCAPPTAAAPVVIPFIPAGFVTGSTSGSFVGFFLLTPTEVGFVKSGQAYVNIHSDTYPGGEIRGNIAVIPEPATLALLPLALGLIVWRRRKP
jgi:hypothetical protein